MENLKLKLGFAGVGLFALGALVLSGAPSSNLLANLTGSADEVEQIEENTEEIEVTVEEIEEAPEEVTEPIEEPKEDIVAPQNEPDEEPLKTLEVSTELASLRLELENLREAQREDDKVRMAAERQAEYEEKWEEITERNQPIVSEAYTKMKERAASLCGKYVTIPSKNPVTLFQRDADCEKEYLSGVREDSLVKRYIREWENTKNERTAEYRALNEEYNDLPQLRNI